MSTIQILMLATILVYLIGMVAIGAVLAKENRTTDDFYLGGRKLGPFVTAMSAEASDMSSWLLMGLPGVAYLTGTADAAWTARTGGQYLSHVPADLPADRHRR